MELISKEYLLKAFDVFNDEAHAPDGWMSAMRTAREIVEDAPDIVRCKDCIHRPVRVWRDEYDDFDVLAPMVDDEEDYRCPCTNEEDPYYSFVPDDDFFCAYGERRECNADAEGKG